MPASNLFSRMGGWFKPGGSTKISAADPAQLDEDGLLKPGQDASNRGGVSTLLSRWQERSQSLERLEDGYQKLTDLVDGIQTHLQNQDERSRTIANGLNSMAEHVARLPDVFQQQNSQIAAIVEQLECAGARSGRIEATLGELPKVVDSQRESLLAVRDQIESSTRTQQSLVDSMGELAGAISALNQSSTDSVQTIKSVQVSAEASQVRLADLVSEHSRKLTKLIGVGLGVAGLLTVATVVSMFLWKTRARGRHASRLSEREA